MSVTELMRFKGIGEAKAISIVAALELGAGEEVLKRMSEKTIKSSRDAFEYFYASLADLQYEQFWVMLLSQSHKVIRTVQVSDGGLTGTVADPKRILK